MLTPPESVHLRHTHTSFLPESSFQRLLFIQAFTLLLVCGCVLVSGVVVWLCGCVVISPGRGWWSWSRPQETV